MALGLVVFIDRLPAGWVGGFVVAFLAVPFLLGASTGCLSDHHWTEIYTLPHWGMLLHADAIELRHRRRVIAIGALLVYHACYGDHQLHS